MISHTRPSRTREDFGEKDVCLPMKSDLLLPMLLDFAGLMPGIQEGNRRLARRPPIGESSNVIVPS
jgi:hypothetical protein